MTDKLNTIAILGGTGGLGTGLARRWAQAGYPLVIGSRNAEKAQHTSYELQSYLEARGCARADIRGLSNQQAAVEADIVVLTVPFAHHAATLQSVKNGVQGKIVIDATVPLVPPKVARVQLPQGGSAGQIAQQILGEDVRVVSAFQNAAAVHLQEGSNMDCDILVCGNNKAARAEVIKLVEAAGLRGLHAGSINNAAAVEALTSLLIFMNKQYSGHSGIRVTGLDQS